MTIMLTALEREALDDCLTTYMRNAEGLDYANGNPIIAQTQKELELDLSSVAKWKFATFVAATLEAMIARDMESGWSSPKSRRDACLRLASKIDAAVDAANGVEFTGSAEVSLPSVAQGYLTRTELVPGKRYVLPGTGSNTHIALIYQGHAEGMCTFSNADGEGEYNYAAEDLTELVALPEADELVHITEGRIVALEPGDRDNGTSVALVPAVPAQLEPKMEEANAASHPIVFPDVALSAVVATETPSSMVTTAGVEPPMTNQALVNSVPLSDEHSAEGRPYATLDAAVDDAAVVPTMDGESLTESSDLLRELETFLRERTVLPEERFYYPLTLWAAHTHCWQACAAELPYLNLTGASGTGKNHTLKLIGSLSNNFLFVARGTEAALRDLVNLESPTLGVAECESELRKHNSYVHILFNSGNVPGEPFRKILRGTSEEYHVYCPKMMATIGDVEPSLRSRCIVVPMSVGTPLIGDLEPAYQRGRILAQRLHSLIESRESEISNCYYRNVASKTHERLVGRAWKIWLLLFAICEVLAPERLVELEHAATFCSSFKSRPLRSVREMHALQADRELVVNCQQVVLDAALLLVDYPGKNVATNDLIAKLLAMPHGWWVGYQCVDSGGRGIGIGDGESGRMTLAKMFKIAVGEIISPPAPHYIGPGKTARGYIVAEVLAAARTLKGEGGNVVPDPGDEDSGQSGG